MKLVRRVLYFVRCIFDLSFVLINLSQFIEMVSEFVLGGNKAVLVLSLIASVYCDNNTPHASNCTRVFIQDFSGDLNYRMEFMSIVSKCPNGYRHRDIRRKCETPAPDVDILDDIFLFALILKLPQGIPYLNVYCAICHNETDLVYFAPHLHYDVDDSDVIGDEERKYYPTSQHHLVLGNLTSNEAKTELVSTYGGVNYKFRVLRVLLVFERSLKHYSKSMSLQNNLTFCESMPNHDFMCENLSSIADCFFKDNEFSNAFDLWSEIGRLYESGKCTSKSAFCPERKLPRVESCKYRDKYGDDCIKNRFLLGGVQFTYGERGEVFYAEEGTKFGPDQYTNETGVKKAIYLCGAQRKPQDQYCVRIIHDIKSSSRRISLFFVMVYLLLNGNKKVLSELPDKITYSCSVTLLLMYVREEITVWSDYEGCFLKYYGYRYLSQAYCCWMLMSSVCLWYTVKWASKKDAKSVGNWHLKIYAACCIFGWVLPALCAFLFYHQTTQLMCPAIPGYVNLITCKKWDERDAYFWFSIATIVAESLVVLGTFISACCYYFRSDCNCRSIRCGELRMRMFTFVKIVYSMGLYLMVVLSALMNLNESAYTILVHLWSFHGTFIFFAYGFKVRLLKNVCGQDVQQACTGPVGSSRRMSGGEET